MVLSTANSLSQSAGSIEYNDCISVEGSVSHNECPGYNTKSDGEAPVMLELWGMGSTLLSPSLPGPLWPKVVAPDRVLSIGQIELNRDYAKLNCLKITGFFFTFNIVYLCLTKLFKLF